MICGNCGNQIEGPSYEWPYLDVCVDCEAYRIMQPRRSRRNPEHWKVICAYCGKHLQGDLEGKATSHGCCQQCFSIEIKKAQAVALKKRQKTKPRRNPLPADKVLQFKGPEGSAKAVGSYRNGQSVYATFILDGNRWVLRDYFDSMPEAIRDAKVMAGLMSPLTVQPKFGRVAARRNPKVVCILCDEEIHNPQEIKEEVCRECDIWLREQTRKKLEEDRKRRDSYRQGSKYGLG